MKVLRNLILVSNKGKLAESAKPASPIITPESTSDSGYIVDFGPDVEGFDRGQRVYFLSQYKKTLIKGEEFLVMEDSNIFAISE